MNWHYRTILFEFQKDGLLGDKYVDDEEVEKILNEQGEQGWELVSVTAVQEGLLTFFKRLRPQPASQAAVSPTPPVQPRPASPLPPVAVSPPATQPAQPHPPQALKKKTGTIGEIKIS